MVDNVTNTIVEKSPAEDFGSIGVEYAAPLVAGMTLAAVAVAGVGLVASVGAAELGTMLAADAAELASDFFLLFPAS